MPCEPECFPPRPKQIEVDGLRRACFTAIGKRHGLTWGVVTVSVAGMPPGGTR